MNKNAAVMKLSLPQLLTLILLALIFSVNAQDSSATEDLARTPIDFSSTKPYARKLVGINGHFYIQDSLNIIYFHTKDTLVIRVDYANKELHMITSGFNNHTMTFPISEAFSTNAGIECLVSGKYVARRGPSRLDGVQSNHYVHKGPFKVTIRDNTESVLLDFLNDYKMDLKSNRERDRSWAEDD